MNLGLVKKEESQAEMDLGLIRHRGAITRSLVGLGTALRCNILIVLLEVYLTVTMILYATGPFEYRYRNLPILIGLVVSYQFAFLFGYLVRLRKDKRLKDRDIEHPRIKLIIGYANINILLTIINIIFGLLILTYVAVTLHITNPGSFMGHICSSISNLGAAYKSSVGMGDTYGANSVWIARAMAILSPATFTAYISGLYYFFKTKLYTRLSTVFVALVMFLQTIMTGQNIGIFTTLLIIVSVIFIKKTGYLAKKTEREKVKNNIIIAIVVIVFFSVFLGFFSASILGRMKPSGPISEFTNVKVNQNNWVLKYLPEKLRNTAIMLNVYSSSGYNAMDIALSMDHRPTYGFGNSFFSLNVAKKITGDKSLYYSTYQYRMRSIWSPTINWHTAYVWFANDFTFVGVVAVMFALGWLFALVKAYAQRGYIFAVAMFSLMIEMVLFFPCNNLIFGSPANYTQAVGLLFLLTATIYFSKKRLVYV